jgi:predicted RNA-binding protein with EMAP domain
VGSKYKAVSAKELLTLPNNYIREVQRNYYCYISVSNEITETSSEIGVKNNATILE